MLEINNDANLVSQINFKMFINQYAVLNKRDIVVRSSDKCSDKYLFLRFNRFHLNSLTYNKRKIEKIKIFIRNCLDRLHVSISVDFIYSLFRKFEKTFEKKIKIHKLLICFTLHYYFKKNFIYIHLNEILDCLDLTIQLYRKFLYCSPNLAHFSKIFFETEYRHKYILGHTLFLSKNEIPLLELKEYLLEKWHILRKTKNSIVIAVLFSVFTTMTICDIADMLCISHATSRIWRYRCFQ